MLIRQFFLNKNKNTTGSHVIEHVMASKTARDRGGGSLQC